MSFKKTLLSTLAVSIFALPAFADTEIMIKDAYARASSPTAMAGAAFFHVMNHGDEDDRLIGAKSDAAKRVELHTHKEDANGVMKMMHVEEGFPIAADSMHALKRGGDHVMFMGLTQPFEDGTTISVTLVFEKAGEMTVEIPVDLNRKPMAGEMSHDHSASN